MMKTKQIAYLKSLAHPLKACFQIGKDGLSDNLLKDILNYLNKHELMKISILNNSDVNFEQASNFFKNADIEIVQIIGRVMVLYKHSDTISNPIQIPE